MRLVIRRPDDWHVHLRDGALLAAVAPHSAVFGRILAMPNLVPPVAQVRDAIGYRERIRAALPADSPTVPKLACYLTDHTDPDDLEAGFNDEIWTAAKWYPAGATTNAHRGVTTPEAIMACLERMAAIGMPLCVHAETTDPTVDIFDREAVFLDTILGPLLDRIPVRCVVEHATTREAIAFVSERPNTAATLTPHHLWWSRNALFDGGLRPHAYCLPVLKREEDRRALVDAAVSGSPRFFAGTDSAPHLVAQKEKDCGCAGVFNAPTALAAYAEIFDRACALDKLEAFLSLHGATFYGIPPADPSDTLTLVRGEPRLPFAPAIDVEGAGAVRVFLGDQPLSWSVLGDGNRATGRA